ncbi:GNAT family protein [Streptomyces sp. NPDC052107]|uniref:GNAT family N-acetyltransferase n=1 Tax=Streptomyces sp. NPDC052107 TaxID=3155632 RepID=UPI003422DB3D
MTGRKTILRPFAEGDADVMWEIMADPEVLRFTCGPSTELTLERVRSRYGSRATAPDRLGLAVTDPETGELLGEVVLSAYDPAAGSCTFRTLIGPRGRGRGIGTETTRLIVGYGFEQLALHRVQLEVHGHNARARRVYEKVGFTVEGVRREVQRRDGEWADEVIMSILEQAWAALGSDALSPTAR